MPPCLTKPVAHPHQSHWQRCCSSSGRSRLSGGGQQRHTTTTATSSIAPPPPLSAPPPVAATPFVSGVSPRAPALESLLLSPEQINAIMGVSGLGLQDTYSNTGRLNEGGHDDLLSFTPMNCLGAAFGPMEPDYGGSGYTEVQGREMTETDGSYHHWVDQAAVSFRSASDASAFLLGHAMSGGIARKSLLN